MKKDTLFISPLHKSPRIGHFPVSRQRDRVPHFSPTRTKTVHLHHRQSCEPPGVHAYRRERHRRIPKAKAYRHEVKRSLWDFMKSNGTFLWDFSSAFYKASLFQFHFRARSPASCSAGDFGQRIFLKPAKLFVIAEERYGDKGRRTFQLLKNEIWVSELRKFRRNRGEDFTELDSHRITQD